MTTNYLWFSSVISVQDRAVRVHQARLACIRAAIHELGRLREHWGVDIDENTSELFKRVILPADVSDANGALWKAYHAERERGRKLAESEQAHQQQAEVRS